MRAWLWRAPTRTVRVTTKGDSDPLPQTHVETLTRELNGLGLGTTATPRNYGPLPYRQRCINNQCVLPPAIMKLRISHPTTRFLVCVLAVAVYGDGAGVELADQNRFEQRRTEDNS